MDKNDLEQNGCLIICCWSTAYVYQVAVMCNYWFQSQSYSA